MIQTKVKCDCTEGHYYRTAPEVPISEAVSKGWWEISNGVENAIIISRPKLEATMAANKAIAKHACSVDCARKIVAEFAEELIPDVILEAPIEKEAEV
jgi:hypothetical protein